MNLDSDSLLNRLAPIDFDLEAIDNLFAPQARELDPSAGDLVPEPEVLEAILVTDHRKRQIRQQLTAGVPVRYIVTEP